MYFRTDFASYARQQPVKYEYAVKNGGSGSAAFGFMGANLLNGAGQFMLFKLSWQGVNADTKWPLNPGDELQVFETLDPPGAAGNYHIQAAICYSIPKDCNTPGAGEWEVLGTVSFSVQ